MAPHVMLITQFFHPDLSAISQMGTDLAEDLVAFGFRVTVVAGRGTYLGGERLPDREDYRGIRILRPQGTSLGKGSLAARLTDYLSFSASAFAKIALAETPNIILAMSTPPFVPALAVAMRLFRGVPFVYWAQDLYPELAIAFGILRRHSFSARVLERISSLILKRADAIVTIGEAMADRLVGKGARPDSVSVIPNWADADAVQPLEHANNRFRSSHGWQGKRVILYSGNMGRSHDIETILSAAEALRARQDLVWVFIGDGIKRSLVEGATRHNPAIRLLPYQPRKLLSESLSSADVHMVTQENSTLGLMEPSKLYGVMAVARPVLFIGPRASEVAQTVLRERIGEVIANGDVGGVLTALERLLRNGHDMGLRGRAAVEGRLGRKARTSSIATLLSALELTSHRAVG